MKISNKLTGALCFAVLAFTSCDKDDTKVDPPIDAIKPYTVPTTYNFDNVENASARASVAMWQGFQVYLGKSVSRQLSQDTVNYLWNNTNNAFTAEMASNLAFTPQQLGAIGFGLASYTLEPALIKGFADSMVKVSQYYNTPAARGVAGKQGSRLVNHTGLEFNQAVAKGMMGLFQLSKILQHLEASKTKDNKTVVAGSGTAMQHEWDLALGYLNMPANYDTSVSYANTDANRPLALGGYFRERGKKIQSGLKTFNAFLKGRAAIGGNDYKVRDEQIEIIKEFLEKTIAASLYYYVTSPQGASSSLDNKLHALSEAYGFMIALRTRPASSKLSSADYQKLEQILKTDFYTLLEDATFTKLMEAQTLLSNVYGTLQ